MARVCNWLDDTLGIAEQLPAASSENR
jgi:hypothetical protein